MSSQQTRKNKVLAMDQIYSRENGSKMVSTNSLLKKPSSQEAHSGSENSQVKSITPLKKRPKRVNQFKANKMDHK